MDGPLNEVKMRLRAVRGHLAPNPKAGVKLRDLKRRRRRPRQQLLQHRTQPPPGVVAGEVTRGDMRPRGRRGQDGQDGLDPEVEEV